MKSLTKESSVERNKVVVIVDGMNLFHRMYHIFNKFPYGTPFGFLSGLVSYAEILKSDRFIVCWDGKKNWRKDADEEYKKKRENRFTPDEQENFQRNYDNTIKLLVHLGIIQIIKDDCEADDIIALLTLAYNRDVTIVSNDKDFMQLVNDKKNVTVLRPGEKSKHTLYHEKEVLATFNVPANKIAAFLAIAGDASDGVKGVYKFGAVKAKKLINDGMIKTDKLKEVFNDEQLKQFIDSYKLVKLGKGKYHHIKLTTGDINFGCNYRNNRELFFTTVQALLTEFGIKKYKAIMLKNFYNPQHKIDFLYKFLEKK